MSSACGERKPLAAPTWASPAMFALSGDGAVARRRLEGFDRAAAPDRGGPTDLRSESRIAPSFTWSFPSRRAWHLRGTFGVRNDPFSGGSGRPVRAFLLGATGFPLRGRRGRIGRSSVQIRPVALLFPRRCSLFLGPPFPAPARVGSPRSHRPSRSKSPEGCGCRPERRPQAPHNQKIPGPAGAGESRGDRYVSLVT